MRSIKLINIESSQYYIFNDMINIKNFDSHLLSLEKISFKNIDAVTYRIKYITMKSLDHVNIDSAKSLYLVFNNVDGYIEENNGNKYLIFCLCRQEQKALKK